MPKVVIEMSTFAKLSLSSNLFWCRGRREFKETYIAEYSTSSKFSSVQQTRADRSSNNKRRYLNTKNITEFITNEKKNTYHSFEMTDRATINNKESIMSKK